MVAFILFVIHIGLILLVLTLPVYILVLLSNIHKGRDCVDISFQQFKALYAVAPFKFTYEEFCLYYLKLNHVETYCSGYGSPWVGKTFLDQRLIAWYVKRNINKKRKERNKTESQKMNEEFLEDMLRVIKMEKAEAEREVEKALRENKEILERIREMGGTS